MIFPERQNDKTFINLGAIYFSTANPFSTVLADEFLLSVHILKSIMDSLRALFWVDLPWRLSM